MVLKEEVLKRILKYNSASGRTVKALNKVYSTTYPAGTNLVVEFVKEFKGLPYGDNGMKLDNKADCSQFWINVLYYWFGFNDIGSYTEALYNAKRGKHITEKDIKPLCIILYKLSSRNKHATHAAGYLGNGLMADTRSKLNPLQIRSFNWKKNKITAIVNFLTDEQYNSVIVGSGVVPMPIDDKVKKPKAKDMPELKKGADNEYVAQLQRLLNANGANLQVDGEFGRKTFKAVKTYQKKYKLEVDGIVGPLSWKALLG